MKKLFIFVLTVVMLFSLFTGAASAEADYSGVISIVHFNDIHGAVTETNTSIGLAKIAAFADEMREKNPNTLVLDAGDEFTGSYYVAFDKGYGVAAALNTIGIDAMAAGNSDFAIGQNRLLEMCEILNFPVLAGNMAVTETGEQLLEGYTIITLANGMKIGIISVTTPMSTAGLTAGDPIAAAEELISLVKPQVELVVGLVHLGDGAGVTSVDLANEVEGFDVIIDGHSHTALEEGRVENGVLIAQAGSNSNYIGIVDLTLEAGVVVDVTARLVTREEMEDYPEDQETAAIVEKLVADCDTALAETVAYTDTYLLATREIIRTQETNTGNLFTDAMRAGADADIGIVWSGPIGGDIEAGPLTRADIYSIVRADSIIMKMEMTGEAIVDALNIMVDAYPEVSGNFPQVSGIKFKFDPDQESGNKVFDVTVNGEPIDLNKNYTVATYEAFFGVVGVPESGIRLGDYGYVLPMIESYIIENSPVNPQAEGRITAAQKSGISFTDVPADSWYYNAVKYVADEGLFTWSDSSFEPNAAMERDGFVSALEKLVEKMGGDASGIQASFEDITATEGGLSREEMIALTMRFADYMGITLDVSKNVTFTDAAAISGWALGDVNTASSAGLISGYTDGSFRPDAMTTRAEAATVLMNFIAIIETQS